MFSTVMCIYSSFISIDYCLVVISLFTFISKFVPVHYIVHIMYCVLFLLLYENHNSHRILHRQNLPTLKTPSSFDLANTVVKVGYYNLYKNYEQYVVLLPLLKESGLACTL